MITENHSHYSLFEKNVNMYLLENTIVFISPWKFELIIFFPKLILKQLYKPSAPLLQAQICFYMKFFGMFTPSNSGIEAFAVLSEVKTFYLILFSFIENSK